MAVAARVGELPALRMPFTPLSSTHASTQAPDPDPPAPPKAYPPLNLHSTSTAYARVPTPELARGAAVLGACAAATPFAHRTDALLETARKVLGRRLVDAALEKSLYAHFCAGGSAEEAAKGAARALASRGVRSILNYAAEDATTAELASGRGGGVEEEGGVVDPSAVYDRRLATFLESVAWTDASPASSPGVVAVKCTALMPPDVLERASAALMKAGGGGGGVEDRAAAARASLRDSDAESWDAGWARLTTLFNAAQAKSGPMRVIIDAEQTWLQPAIDALAERAAREYNDARLLSAVKNHGGPLILNTYQCYLTSTASRLARDASIAAAEGWAHGVKPVRGAYLTSETARALAAHTPSPCHPTIDATHAAYDASVARALDAVAAGRAELMVATHNTESIALAAEGAAARGLDRGSSPLLFGQLKGMADQATLALAGAGYQVYKILAYGPLSDTVPLCGAGRRTRPPCRPRGGRRARRRGRWCGGRWGGEREKRAVNHSFHL